MGFDRYAKEYRRKGLGRSRIRQLQRASNRRWRLYTLVIVVLAIVAAAAIDRWYQRPVVAVSQTRAPAAAFPASATATATASAPATSAMPERTAALAPLSLPADDAAHGSGMEWWYYSGVLDAKNGDRYAFHVAVFVANGLVKHTVMHAALTDLQTGKRFTGQSRTAGSPATQRSDGFEFRQDGWRVSAEGPAHTLRIDFDGAGLALDMRDIHPPVAHRAPGSATPGLLDFGASGISYYYSRPRLQTQGWINVGGSIAEVSGDVWFDHQWGDFDVLTLGWNWFALHLADGSDVMLYQLFDGSGAKVMTAGTVSSDAGGSQPLGPGDVTLTPVRKWTSPKTGVDYSVEWKVKLPSGEYLVTPFLDDSEFDSRETSANIYWEGPVKVGTGANGKVAGGQGFLELSGYDRLHAGQGAASEPR